MNRYKMQVWYITNDIEYVDAENEDKALEIIERRFAGGVEDYEILSEVTLWEAPCEEIQGQITIDREER